MRVALAAAARRLLDELDVRVGSWVTSIGSARARDVSGLEGMEDAEALALKADASAVRCIDRDADEAFRDQIEEARARRDTVGGTFEVRVTGLVPGLGSYTQADLRLDGLLARALASIPPSRPSSWATGGALPSSSAPRSTIRWAAPRVG